MSDFISEWKAWRGARDARLRDPRGWLAITAIHWLTPTPQRFDDIPGDWTGDEYGAAVSLLPDEILTLEGLVLEDGVHHLGPLDETGLTLTFGRAAVEVAGRDGQPIMLPRHPDLPHFLDYLGTPYYPPDPDWTLPGRFVRYRVPEGEAVGEVVFSYGGDEHRLVAWSRDDASLRILFRDATSGVTTHAAGRELLVGSPRPGGAVRVDLNRAVNTPGAYTEFVTCPPPPAANTLSFAVEAGEQVPVFA